MKAFMAAGLAALLVAASPAAKVDDLAWMAGQWSREEDGRWTEESWTSPRGGAMLGHSRSGAGEKQREFEFLRIAPDAEGVPTYYAQPGGRPPVAFRLAEREGTRATFENPAHDYPQRITYVRDGDTLTATISAIDGSQAMGWTFQRR
jgi:hypothetical protein